MSQALFYPWIDIQDEAWLKSSLLYWDSVRTIVPESIEAPYSTETGRALAAAGFLRPLRVQTGMDEIEELTGDVMSFLGSSEGAELLLSERWHDRRHDINVEKLPARVRRLTELHPDKLPYEIRRTIEDFAKPSDRGGEWLRVDEGFASFYMTLLASRLAERIGARLLTSLPAADRLAVASRLDAQLNTPLGMRGGSQRWREYDTDGPRRLMPKNLARGLLANLAIEQIGIAPDTSVDRLIEFRDRHRDELALFRIKIDQLAASVEEDLPVEALRQRITDLHANEVAPAISDLNAALAGRRIKSLSEGMLKIAFLSAAPTSVLVLAGLAVPIALLAGAGISLIAAATTYNVDKRELLRSNPFTYLLSARRELHEDEEVLF